jgi:O-antigen biosynthesis protein
MLDQIFTKIIHYLRLVYYLCSQETLLKVLQSFFYYVISLRKNSIIDLEKCLSNFNKEPRQITLPVKSPIDIIIPVYNGFEFLEKLFESIFENTNIPYRLIIIDDCSTDIRVLPYLQKIQLENPYRTLLVKNTHNMGFVKSVNMGFRYTNNHFVLLNSDVEVPPSWLERLMEPIFRNSNIASTIPFSNAADIYSFPMFPENNPIFEDLDLKILDSFFQYVDTKNKMIEIPTGVGFCMGINQSVANRIGMFDSKTFHQGYCEENDWCMRARKHGFKNVLVPNLFVYHKQGGSFLSKGKKMLIEKNYWLLIKRHKEYLPAIFDFTLNNPLKHLREFLILIITINTIASEPEIILGNHTGKISTNRNYGNKLLQLLFEKKSNRFLLRYFYRGYKSHFFINNQASLDKLCNWMQIEKNNYQKIKSYSKHVIQ